MTEPKKDPATEPIKEDKAPEVDPVLSKEIEGAVETVAAENKKAKAQNKKTDPKPEETGDDLLGEDKKDLPPDETRSGEDEDDEPLDGDKKEEDPIKKDDEPSVPDELVERAVKAGMTIADARSFKDSDALERTCSLLEAKAKPGEPVVEKGKAEGGTEDGEDKELVELIGKIPELDPDLYDEKVIEVVTAMREVSKALASRAYALKLENATLRESKSGAESTSWLDSQVAGLGKAYEDAIKAEPAKRAELQEKLTILEAGYKATGKEVPRESVFQEAASLVLKEAAAKAEETEKAEALKKRSKQHINRPGGSRVTPKGDPLEEIAAEVDKTLGRS